METDCSDQNCPLRELVTKLNHDLIQKDGQCQLLKEQNKNLLEEVFELKQQLQSERMMKEQSLGLVDSYAKELEMRKNEYVQLKADHENSQKNMIERLNTTTEQTETNLRESQNILKMELDQFKDNVKDIKQDLEGRLGNSFGNSFNYANAQIHHEIQTKFEQNKTEIDALVASKLKDERETINDELEEIKDSITNLSEDSETRSDDLEMVFKELRKENQDSYNMILGENFGEFYQELELIKEKAKNTSATDMNGIRAYLRAQEVLLKKLASSGDLKLTRVGFYHILDEIEFDAFMLHGQNEATILHIAAEKGCGMVVDALLEITEKNDEKYYRYSVDENESTPLHLAVKYNSLNIVFKLLQNAEPDYCTQEDSNGNTSLHLAAERENEEIMENVVEFAPPSSIEKLNKFNETPLDIAIKSKNYHLIAVILNAARREYMEKFGVKFRECYNCVHACMCHGKTSLVIGVDDRKAIGLLKDKGTVMKPGIQLIIYVLKAFLNPETNQCPAAQNNILHQILVVAQEEKFKRVQTPVSLPTSSVIDQPSSNSTTEVTNSTNTNSNYNPMVPVVQNDTNPVTFRQAMQPFFPSGFSRTLDIFGGNGVSNNGSMLDTPSTDSDDSDSSDNGWW
eukprot:TRINITY_DN6891_c0_g1_i1.p1 TRINITY_DN6891_c0_g1~~TRINITY_DN6891_c0_g1_i1.p1  ORF type:complete len:627 (+),score=166.12 TRINITY_DN6891_c0_g1_i1:121-2001(+)